MVDSPVTPLPDVGVDLGRLGADRISAVGTMSNEQLWSDLDALFRQMAAAMGDIALRLGETDRRQAYRDEGATSTARWAVERYGIAAATARALMRVGEKAWDVPHLVGALCAGDVSLDKVKAVIDVATPETDAALCGQAAVCSVRDLAEIARTTETGRAVASNDAAAPTTAAPPAAAGTGASDHARRYLRFNDDCRALTAQLPPDSYAEVKAGLESIARAVPSDGDTPWDQRLCDGLVGLVASSASGVPGQAATAGSRFVVVHVPLAALVDDSIEPTQLAGELEHDGLIDCETVQRIVCDATVAVAVEDDVGHTMYEGRARRSPTDAQRREVTRRDRHCRFPGCTGVTFTNVHHIAPWGPGGRTDTDNLALMCLHHHHTVHSKGWTMSGDANEELRFVGPTGRIMRSRPSPFWTRASRLTGSGRTTGVDVDADAESSAAAAP